MATIYNSGLFKVRLFKESITAPGDPWVTNYVFNVETADIAAVAPDVIEAFAQWECKFLSADAVINTGTASTYDAEEGDYDPSHFMVHELGEAYEGERTSDGMEVDRNIVLNFKKAVQAGHQGKIALRGALFSDEIGALAAGGKMGFAPGKRAFLETIQETAQAIIEPFLADGIGPASLVMVSPGPGGTRIIRPVQFLELRGPTTNNGNHKYYNRGA